MTRIYSILIALCIACTLLAQAPKGSTLQLAVFVEEAVDPFPVAAKAQLENKLHQLLTQNGISSIDYNNQFVITAFTTPLSKNIVPGPPPQVAQQMELTFYIADVYNKTVFSTTSITVTGVGTTEAKSYLDAFKHINLKSDAMNAFVAAGKKKVIDYYDMQAPIIFKKADALATQHKYEEALWLVSLIPSECKYFDEAIAQGNTIFAEYNTYLCNVHLAQARVAWVAGQNAEAAALAGEHLAYIYPDAGCYEEAMELYNEIKAKVLDDWKFEMKKYQDQIDLEAARIDSWREVGVAYGSNQPRDRVNIDFLR